MFRPALLFILLISLAACQTLSESERAELQRHRVSPALIERMAHRDPLTLADVVELSRKRIDDGFIIHYLKISDSVYSLRAADVTRLQKEGVDEPVIDYMLGTSAMFAARYAWYPYPYDPWLFYPPEVVVVGRGYFHHHH